MYMPGASKKISVVFRADASLLIGSGHIMRCLTLANVLRQGGATCIFVCREHAGNLLELIRQRGFEAIGLPQREYSDYWSGNSSTSQLTYADWLGESWKRDVEQTLEVLGGSKADWLVVDHYALDYAWEEAMRPSCHHLLVIDDLADRNHCCDLLLDQNLVAQMAERYCERVPSMCKQLLGPRFALLQPEYYELHARVPPRSGEVRRVLVYFGEVDNTNLTGKVVSAFLSLGRSDIRLDIVISSNNVYTPLIRKQVRGLGHIYLHSRLPTLSKLMMCADIAIGGAGATSWERCCLGLPSLIVTLADNQVPIASELQARGMARWLGHADDISEDQLRDALCVEINRGVDVALSSRCHASVDGRGVWRVAGAMMLPYAGKLCARTAVFNDEKFCIELLSVGAKSEKHCELFRSWLRDPLSYLPTIIESDSGYLVGLVVFNLQRSIVHEAIVIDLVAQNLVLHRKVMITAMVHLRKVFDGHMQFLGGPVELNYEERVLDKCSPPSFSGLNISICSDARSWINDSIPEIVLKWLAAGHRVSWVNDADELPGGDICFFLSYGRIVGSKIRSRYRNCLVIHASDLPKGRGWSPASWLILEGADCIPVKLLEAVDQVDAGPIYSQYLVKLEGNELINDWHALLADATVRLVSDFVAGYPASLLEATVQTGEPTFYRRRRPEDSEVDPTKPLTDIFCHLRIADYNLYPVYFRHLNAEFSLQINRKT